MKINIKKIFKLELKEFIKSKKFLIIFISCLLGLFVILFVFSYQVEVPLSKNVEERIFIVEQGQGSEEIAENLRTEGLISNKWAFFYYIWLEGKTKGLQAGEYSLTPSMSILEIAKKILEGDVIKDWIKVTIPEGWSIKKIEERLATLGLIKPGEKLPQKEEGYLFPDTYYFYKEVTIEQIIEKMQDNFDRKVDEELKKEIGEQEKTLNEIIILASIIQNEVILVKDMKIIAGIFYNRLEIGMALQSDATVNYVTGKGERQPSAQDIKIDSPYNTYIHRGFPPGPISNPGLDAIKAAIYPEDTDYLYFLNPLDGTTIFSKTLEEHNRNKAKYLDNRVYPE